ncbi:MAG: hypothetical protein HYZ14_00545 [Bacteroidetes bacterium]|nr:hypothetical protein [Bacteroidota bacterium]
MSYVGNQVCIFSAYAENDAVQVQDKLLQANVDVILLNKKDSTYGTTDGKVELYVPLLQAEKAKLLIKKLHD